MVDSAVQTVIPSFNIVGSTRLDCECQVLLKVSPFGKNIISQPEVFKVGFELIEIVCYHLT